MPLNRRCFAVAVAIPAVCALLTGCGNNLNNGGQDVDLIAEHPSKPSEQPQGSGPLWALSPGKSWHTITMRPGQPNVNSEIRVIGPYRLADGRTGTLVQSSRNGKPFRVEVYQTTPAGAMNMIALGESEKKLLVFTPAIPVLAAPAQEGHGMIWSGTARIDNKDYNANAFHRLSAVESVKTPFDSYRTFRLDGIITLFNGAQRVDYPVVMWLLPGKGIAQRRLADKGSLALEIITRF